MRALLLVLRAAVAREWRDGGRRLVALCAVFGLLSWVMTTGDARHSLPRAAVAVAIVAPFACVAVPASVVDDAASGLVRLVAAQPVRRGAYAAMRIFGLATILWLALAPFVAAVAWLEGTPPLPAVGALALSASWSAAASVYLGLLFRGPSAATGAWCAVCVANLLAMLSPWRGFRMDDWIVRARHALPASASVEALTPGMDPWGVGAPVVLLLETALVAAAALLHMRAWRPGGAGGGAWRAGLLLATLAATVGLPFVLRAEVPR